MHKITLYERTHSIECVTNQKVNVIPKWIFSPIANAKHRRPHCFSGAETILLKSRELLLNAQNYIFHN